MFQATRLLEVPVDLLGQRIVALIDCGATHNFISEDLVANLGLDAIECKPLRVTLADQSVAISAAHVSCELGMGFAAVPVTL